MIANENNPKCMVACKSEQNVPEFALVSGSMDDSDCWWLDSGCSQHMTHVASDFKDYVKFDVPLKVNLADESVFFSYGSGDVNMQLLDDNSEAVDIVFKDVLYVPKLQKKLLSITSMTKRGATVQFEGNSCTLLMKKRKFLFGHRHGKLWKLNCLDASCFFGSSGENSLKLWHLRLGHLKNNVKLLFKNKMVNGLSLTPGDQYEEPCHGCALSKHVFVFPKRVSTNQFNLLN